MAHYWARFAAAGDPNAAGQPRWPRYDPVADALLRLDERVGAAGAPYVAACAIAERADHRH
jgi:carboxylesterase type B